MERPFGILKESTALRLFTGARQGVLFVVHPTRINETDPSESHSFISGWLAVYEKGEPYDTPEGAALAAMLRNKSAFFADDYFAGLRTRTVDPVPILAVQGWNDAFFPPVEALQMYRKLKAIDRGYPISIFLGDIGHANGRGHGTDQVKTAWRALANEFLDAHVLRGGGGTPQQIVSMSTECASGSDPVPASETVIAGDWDSIHPSVITLKSERPLTTLSGPPNYLEELPTDPSGGGCITQSAGTYNSDGDYRWAVPLGGFTLLGLPELKADYRLLGMDATVIAKLWDVDAGGNRTLVTRGMYRLSVVGGNEPDGTLKFSLFGNHYRFENGHSIELEISQTDHPFLRPDNLPSTIAYEDIKLELPTQEMTILPEAGRDRRFLRAARGGDS